jgi:WD40 repeat protein
VHSTLQGHTGIVRALAFTPDGPTLASRSTDWSVRLWDVATGRERAALVGHTQDVYSLALTPDGKTLVEGSLNWGITLWEAATGRQRGVLPTNKVASRPWRAPPIAGPLPGTV